MSDASSTIDETSRATGAVDELTAAAEAGLGAFARSPLGQSLVRARREHLASGQPFLTLDEIRDEVAARRGGIDERDDR